MNSPSTSERGEHYPNAVVMPAAWFRSSMVVAASAVIFSAFDVCMRRACLANGVCESANGQCECANSAACSLALFPASFYNPCLHAYMSTCNACEEGRQVARVI
jgi:hypothetical protein